MTFAFFPAVDLRGGKCVQLVGGVPGTEVVALDNPLAQAERWVAEGADHLHIIDLDGAILGKRVNASILSQIVKKLDLFIQVGGGIRTEEDVSTILDLGVDRAILGTAALKDPDMVSRLADRHGRERIMVALDVRRGDVTTEGWQKTLGKKAVELGRLFEEKGAGSILFTNIDVEGRQLGIDLQPTRDLVQALQDSRSGSRRSYSHRGCPGPARCWHSRSGGGNGDLHRQALRAPDPGGLEVKIMRKGEAEGLFRECRAKAALDLDGSGKAVVSSGSGFLDHMLTALARTALLDLTAEAEKGFYRTQALGAAIGLALDSSLGDRSGIRRYGAASVPMDEALADVALDFSGRPYLVMAGEFRGERIGDFEVQLLQPFLEALCCRREADFARALLRRE